MRKLCANLNLNIEKNCFSKYNLNIETNPLQEATHKLLHAMEISISHLRLNKVSERVQSMSN